MYPSSAKTVSPVAKIGKVVISAGPRELTSTTGRHLRISRVTKRTNRSTAGHDDAHHDHGEPVAIHGTVVHNAKDKKRQAQDAAQAETATAASEEIREPVQATASISEDLQATSDSTAAMSPDANSASDSVAVTATTSEDSATASPASSTPAADTATPTSISIISSVSIIGTPLASSTAVSNTTASSTSSITQSTSSSSSSSSSTSSSSTTSSTSSTSSTVTSTDSTTSEFSAVTSISGSGDGDAGTYFWGGGSQATATGQVTLTMGSTPSATGSASQSSNALDSQTKGKIAGGVVGAVLLLRRRRTNQHRASQVLPPGDMTGTAVGAASVTRSTDMVSRRSSNDPLFTASQSRLSTHTESTLDSSASERGFQKISGRKIPSVLQSGGDGYGGGLSEGSPTVSEPSMSFSPTSPVLPRSPTSQPPPSVPYGMPLDASYTRETEEADPIVIFRPSPARTPVPGSAAASLTNEPSVSRAIQVSQGVLSPTMPRRPDVLGRSHPSFDGSRGSRFTESI
ncbi:hypothetical protein BDV25DRAFT_133608 [Aspergillus avenaceus]|uniref:Uncharacterized protein n=1 Tax=Aspergillus avenaceus TaxID=36643 RepID=A0A5N6TGX6_ASPAV|nr:hypothetical protein BDV25DRAFT_133608 [Aspergillus avenaceus]